MENHLIRWKDALAHVFSELTSDFITSLPNVTGAVIVTVTGVSLAFFLSNALKKLIECSGIDNLIKKTETYALMKERGLDLEASEWLCFSLRWLVFSLTLYTASDILHWEKLTTFLRSVALYLPNVFIAIFIISVGMILGNQYHRTIRKTVRVFHLPPASSRILGELARWAILIFTSMAALNQLGVATDLIRILFTGFVMMVSLAGGLAFGLGGKDLVREWLLSLNNRRDRSNQ